MFPLGAIRRVFVAEYRVNMQQGHDGLLAEAYKLGLNPWAGDLIVFPGICRKRVKMLFADRNGLWVGYKKFTDRRIQSELRFLLEPQAREVTLGELQLLLEGISFTVFDRHESDWHLKAGSHGST